MLALESVVGTALVAYAARESPTMIARVIRVELISSQVMNGLQIGHPEGLVASKEVGERVAPRKDCLPKGINPIPLAIV
eukprot:scaffold26_cov159-Ochromonas_danica.AAC.9